MRDIVFKDLISYWNKPETEDLTNIVMASETSKGKIVISCSIENDFLMSVDEFYSKELERELKPNELQLKILGSVLSKTVKKAVENDALLTLKFEHEEELAQEHCRHGQEGALYGKWY